MSPERLEKINQVLNRRQKDLTVLMEDVHKPQNMAAIVRSCDAVGISDIHVVSEVHTTSFLNSKSAGGTKRWVDIISHRSIDEAYEEFRQNGVQILATCFTDDAVNFREIDYTLPTVIVVGSELEGISEVAAEKADRRILIPMMGMAQSLNVSVATALILFEAQRQRELKGFYDDSPAEGTQPRRFPLEWGHPKLASKFRNHNLPVPEMDENGEIHYLDHEN